MNTTIIIGAGANKEMHPDIGLGPDLLRGISERVTDKTSPHKPYLSNSFKRHLPHLDFETRFNFLQHLERYMKDSENSSIDAFIYEVEKYPEYEIYREKYIEIAQVMVIAHVLGWEGSTTNENIIKEISKKETWFSVLAEYIEKNNLIKNRNDTLKIITFNYDRILEKYLYQRFIANDEKLITSFIKKNIIHVYGCIGTLIESDNEFVRFGHDNNDFKKISEIKDQISWIHNDRDEVEGELQKNIIGADGILVFGYGFDFINNKKLLLDKPTTEKIIAYNIYHGRVVDFEFSIRRKTNQYVRSLARKSEIKFLPSVEFLKWGLYEFQGLELNKF